mmetsp:Transcript_1213/g.2559  ORF Transcript_1213/g.2559 Transcript_1213/m.2559 type:complete len:226 (-) Transcript_1213:1353-2030(-)
MTRMVNPGKIAALFRSWALARPSLIFLEMSFSGTSRTCPVDTSSVTESRCTLTTTPRSRGSLKRDTRSNRTKGVFKVEADIALDSSGSTTSVARTRTSSFELSEIMVRTSPLTSTTTPVSPAFRPPVIRTWLPGVKLFTRSLRLAATGSSSSSHFTMTLSPSTKLTVPNSPRRSLETNLTESPLKNVTFLLVANCERSNSGSNTRSISSSSLSSSRSFFLRSSAA